MYWISGVWVGAGGISHPGVTTATSQGESWEYSFPFLVSFSSHGRLLCVCFEKIHVWPRESVRRAEPNAEAGCYLILLQWPVLIVGSSPLSLCHLESSHSLLCFMPRALWKQNAFCAWLCRHWLSGQKPIILTEYRCGRDPSRGIRSPAGHRWQDPFPKNKLCPDPLVQCHRILFLKYGTNTSQNFQIIIAIIFFVSHKLISALLIEPTNREMKRKKVAKGVKPRLVFL